MDELTTGRQLQGSGPNAPMHFLDLTLPTPEENLACDEAVLNGVETGALPETLRVWESVTPFVVLGVAQTVRDHVHIAHCEADNMPILRRCSAGGCVVQGPGSLNYTLALRYEEHPETQTIRGSYCYILNRLSAAFQRRGLNVRHRGISDLAWDNRKVSGNAQRRRKHAFLHHGTLLYGPENGWMQRYLLEPADRPDYRGDRTHDAFVIRLSQTAAELQELILESFDVSSAEPGSFGHWLEAETRRLVATKYLDSGWHFRR